MNIWDAAKYGNLSTLDEIISENPSAVNDVDASGATPLHWACGSGKVHAIRILLERGASVDRQSGAQGSTPLHWAVAKGQIGSIMELLKAGASLELRDSNGYSATHIAAQNGKVFPLVLLYALVVRNHPEKVSHYFGEIDKPGRTPLHWASIQNHPEAIAFLVRCCRVNIDQGDREGMTALHWAVCQNAERAATALLELGARWDLPDDDGILPLDRAQTEHTKWFAEYLRVHGCVLEGCTVRQRVLAWFYAQPGRLDSFAQLVGIFLYPVIVGILSCASFPLSVLIIGMLVLKLWVLEGTIFKYKDVVETPFLSGILESGLFMTLLQVCLVAPYFYGSVEFFGFWISFLCTVWFYYRLTKSNPGFIPCPGKAERSKIILSLASDGMLDERHFCYTCLLHKPTRSKHCRVCGRCVRMFDHHCPWINCCLGVDNYRLFWHFLLSLTVFSAFYLYHSFLFLRSQSWNLSSGNIFWFVEWTRTVAQRAPFSFWLFCTVAFNSLWILVLTLMQAYQISVNLTSNEINIYQRLEYLHPSDNPTRFFNPYDKGIFRNWINFYSFRPTAST